MSALLDPLDLHWIVRYAVEGTYLRYKNKHINPRQEKEALEADEKFIAECLEKLYLQLKDKKVIITVIQKEK